MHKDLQRLRDGQIVARYSGAAAGAALSLGDLREWVCALVDAHGPDALFRLDCADDAGYEVVRRATRAEEAEYESRRAALAGAVVHADPSDAS